MAIRIAIIGAGSAVFSRRIWRDLLAVPGLQETEFALHDIDAGNLDLAARLADKDVRVNRLPARFRATLDRREALADADYVINCARIGGIEALEADLKIPLEYGVDQCVGDTLSAGGIMYGQRSIPAILDFCRDIREVGRPGCLFINYANPMAMNCWAADHFGGVRVVGLCHGVEAGWYQIAEVLGGSWPAEIDGVCAGINHQTWYIRILRRGRPVSGEELLEAFERHPLYPRTEKCRIDVLRRFGYYSTETNGHLSEYLPWYRKRPDRLHRWIDTSNWAGGETLGYLRLSIETRAWYQAESQRWLTCEDEPIGPGTRSGERVSYIIEALQTGRRIRTYVNVRNQGTIANLPPDCIVEVPAYVDGLGIHVPAVGELPPGCAAVCSASVHVQRLATLAAVRGDAMLLRQAMLLDPLVGAVCDPPEVWQMTDELLVAQEKWLPQYAQAIAVAKQRFAAHPPQRPRRGYHGLQVPVRPLEQLQSCGEFDWMAPAKR